MKITLAGPHGSGKTTVLNDLLNHPYLQKLGIKGKTNVSRSAVKNGFKVNMEGDLYTQIHLTNIHTTNALEKDNFLSDRSFIDTGMYSEYSYNHNKLPKEYYDYSQFLIKTLAKHYDIVFYIPAEFAIKKDEVRITDTEFHQEICDNFEKLIKSNVIQQQTTVVVLTGTRTQRVEQAIAAIKLVVSTRED